MARPPVIRFIPRLCLPGGPARRKILTAAHQSTIRTTTTD
jgi:hypothetical protein